MFNYFGQIVIQPKRKFQKTFPSYSDLREQASLFNSDSKFLTKNKAEDHNPAMCHYSDCLTVTRIVPLLRTDVVVEFESEILMSSESQSGSFSPLHSSSLT